MRVALLCLCLLLAGCSDAPVTPAQCREVGVDVPNGSAITGRIVAQHTADAARVQAACQSPFTPRLGCTLIDWPGEYVIWAVDDARALAHEQCHALFEVWAHT